MGGSQPRSNGPHAVAFGIDSRGARASAIYAMSHFGQKSLSSGSRLEACTTIHSFRTSCRTMPRWLYWLRATIFGSRHPSSASSDHSFGPVARAKFGLGFNGLISYRARPGASSTRSRGFPRLARCISKSSTKDNQFILRDLKSKNGTLVNGTTRCHDACNADGRRSDPGRRLSFCVFAAGNAHRLQTTRRRPRANWIR